MTHSSPGLTGAQNSPGLMGLNVTQRDQMFWVKTLTSSFLRIWMFYWTWSVFLNQLMGNIIFDDMEIGYYL